RLFSRRPGSRTVSRPHREAYPAHIFRRLTPRHPKPTHQRICHLRCEAVTQRRLPTDVRIEHAIDLLARETLGGEQVNHLAETDPSRRLLDHSDYARADGADLAKQTGPGMAVDASHGV